VQAALDRVSKNRTTIMIAHRLATVKKADNIVVLAKGKVVQWGNHESLMAAVGGPYWLLTQSQELKMGEDAHTDDLSEVTEEEKRTMDLMTLDESKANEHESDRTGTDEAIWIPRGVFRSFGTLLLEQKTCLPSYMLMLFGALVAGGKPLISAHKISSLKG
jgi:ABC-type multidrug transport system ATPase subunit